MSISAANTALLFVTAGAIIASTSANACHSLLDFEATKLRSTEQVNFCDAFDGKALLVVNTASKCGFTPQFADLEKLYKEYGDKLAVVGFPSDDFNQEHDNDEKIAKVCRINYGVTFTMLEPSKVKGDEANALYKQLAERTGQQPDWNFNKYLISADGKTITHFTSRVKPQDRHFRVALEKAFGS